MDRQHITQEKLAARWGLSPRTLETWRSRKQGPDFLKIGHRVLYRLSDVEAYEQARRKQAARELLAAAAQRREVKLTQSGVAHV